jgi:acyl-CoA thioesterase I
VAWALAVTVSAGLLAACGGGSGSGGTGGGVGGGGGDAAGAARWVVLGSSTAVGVGATQGQAWAARLDGMLRSRGARVDNRARSGATTYSALPAASARPMGRPATDPVQDVAAVLDSRPSVLILAFPSNDAVSGYPAAETTANLLQMRALALASGVGVIVLSSQPRDDASVQARAAMLATDAALVAEVGACLVDVRAALSDTQDRIAAVYAAGDGIHLNNAGHGVVVERLWATIAGGRCVNPP